MSVDTINERLSLLVPESSSKLAIAARYALLAGGKRVRPLLSLLLADHFNVPQEHVLDSACALEMIHAYSLIHDDLPCMDDDDFRRGIPTVHRQFDEATAILAGDYLLTRAFEVLSSAPHLTDHQRIQMIQLIASASGGEGMIGGQVLDIEAEKSPIGIDELKVIHSKKTGALFVAAGLIPAIAGNLPSHQYESIAKFTTHLGLAFQILDDIKDITESQEKHGNSISSDMRNEKSTYVSLLGLDKAKEFAQKELSYAESLIALDLNAIIQQSTLLPS